MIDELADAWRWWAAPGALLGLWLLGPRIARLLGTLRRMLAHRISLEDIEAETSTILPVPARLATSVFAACFMLGALIAGTIIPIANDGRFAGITRELLAVRGTMAGVWFLWGTSCWGIAISLAPHKRVMGAAAVVMWWAAFVATSGLEGKML